jgi:hypothetical protein
MKWFFKVKMDIKHVLVIFLLSALSCVLLLGSKAPAATLEKSAVDDQYSTFAVLRTERPENRGFLEERSGNEKGQSVSVKQTINLEGDGDDKLLTAEAGAASSSEYKIKTDLDNQARIAANSISPPTPPPDEIVLAANEYTLPAAASGPNPEEPEKSGPAPGPKTSKSSSLKTPLLVTAGIVLAVGAAVAAGGSGSDDSSSTGTTDTSGGTGPGVTPTGATEVIHLADLVRLGDDNDYNGNHPDQFKQNRPSGLSWTDSFNINNFNSVRSAKFKYTIAGSKVANPIYINGRLAGKMCNPGNLATNVRDCSLDILGYIQAGVNEITLKCAIDQSDTSTPYDDVELYNLRIELTR